MNERRRIERDYHGYKVVSVQNLEPVENSDGWEHSVFNEQGEQVATTHTLADAIWLARNIMATPVATPVADETKPETTEESVIVMPMELVDPPEPIESDETETKLPETEEHE